MPRRSRWLIAAAAAGYAFLYVPLAIVVLYSFNDSRLNAEWVGFTLSWYDSSTTKTCWPRRGTRS